MERMAFNGQVLNFNRTLIMGVLNVTPDSFSDGGDFFNLDKAVAKAKAMINEGADIIDVGGESSKPGAEPISASEELSRVKKVIARLSQEINVPISIDTYKPEVAAECIKLGASIINDISGLKEARMAELAAKTKCPIIIMHMQGTPKTMQESPKYNDVVKDIYEFFQERIKLAKSYGIENIILDPGVGFGKTLEHNLEILRRLKDFSKLGYPIMVGVSRKGFIGKINKIDDPKKRLAGTVAAVSVAVMNGANIVRVHDVRECKQAAEIIDAING